jgi:hypothetical protein
MIDKLKRQTYTRVYKDNSEDKITRYPNNSEIMKKINEIIDFVTALDSYNKEEREKV